MAEQQEPGERVERYTWTLGDIEIEERPPASAATQAPPGPGALSPGPPASAPTPPEREGDAES